MESLASCLFSVFARYTQDITLKVEDCLSAISDKSKHNKRGSPSKKATTKNIIYICLHKYQMKPLLLLFIQQIGHLRSRENTFRGAYLSWRRVAFVASLFVIIMRTFFAATTTITMQTWRRIRVKLIFTHTHTEIVVHIFILLILRCVCFLSLDFAFAFFYLFLLTLDSI